MIPETVFGNLLLFLRRRKGEGSETFSMLWILGGIIFVVSIALGFIWVYLNMGGKADASSCASNSGFLNMIYEAWDKSPAAQGCG